MHVELLLVPDCPHRAGATSLLRAALDELGFEDVTIDTTVIDTVEAARHRGFIGSPTFLVNGTDAFPVPGRGPAALPVGSTPTVTGSLACLTGHSWSRP